ncbi:hypothetical protein SAMN04488689_103185 [Paenibacillus sp. cl6col]|nr:hypothetical protein SAMN04488689_103185 [Paenibacillus sp. cl6col]
MVLIYVKWLVFLFVVAIGIGLASAAIRRRVSYIGLGLAGTKPTEQARRTMRAIGQTFGQGKLWKDPRSGFMHAVMFYGFLHLQVGALDLIWKGLTGHSLPLPAHHVFIVAQEWTVLMVLTAVLFAVYRRYVERLPRLKRGVEALNCTVLHRRIDGDCHWHHDIRLCARGHEWSWRA